MTKCDNILLKLPVNWFNNTDREKLPKQFNTITWKKRIWAAADHS